MNERSAASGSQAFLVTSSASLGARRCALAVVIALFVVFCALTPFSRALIPRIEAFIPIFESAFGLINLVTASFLLVVPRMHAVLFLSTGYFFTSLMSVLHMVTFPGPVSRSGFLSLDPHTSA